MKVKSVLSSLFVVAAFIGFVSVGVGHADLGFGDWGGTWFSVQVSEDGLAGPTVSLVLPGGEVFSNDEKTTTNYLFIDAYDFDTATYEVVYCTFDASIWTRHTGLEWPIIGGEPKDFLTFFDFSYTDPQGYYQTYVISLNVEGKEDKNYNGVIKSGSFKNLGGVFRELRADQGGVGSVKKFKGTFVAEDDVVLLVPEGCRIPQGN